MNCDELREIAPLWHSGELDAGRKVACEGHLAGCAVCVAMLREQKALDARLRGAVTLPETGDLDRRIMRAIAAEQRRRWMMMGAVAAVLVAAVLVAGSAGYGLRPRGILAEAARDHRVEVMEHQPRRWRNEVTEFESRFGVTAVKAEAMAPEGYRLLHARVCRLESEPALHLVYTDGTREISVYVRRGGGNRGVREVSIGPERVASAETAAYTMVAVTTGSAEECEKVVRRAAAR